MSWRNKVVWSEGMFLRPQHFQQQARYWEALVEGRCGPIRSHGWGFTELRLDPQLLSMGKLGLSVARGVFPDGTPFNIPDDDAAPLPIEVPEHVRDTVVYLSLPLRRAGGEEVASGDSPKGLARYVPYEIEVRDGNAGMENAAQVQVGKLRMRLLFHSEKHDEYASIGLARVVECRVDRHVVLDEDYVPTVLDCQATPRLAGYLKELRGLLHQRGDALGGRVAASGRGGAAEIADFLLLQAVNRYEPLVAHLTSQRGVHPEDFYRVALEIAGELATFTSENKRADEFPAYRHEDLQASFAPVMARLRQSLSMVLEQNAIPLPLEERKFGIRVSPIADRALLGSASFVLAVAASVPTEELRARFPTQVKIGPVEKIRELVNLQLPGIRVRPLPVAPRQLPYHAGFVYFELDRASELWEQLRNSGGFALHLGGDFPGVRMEFWAIKG